MDKNEKREAKNPRDGANPLSVLFFGWLWKFFRIGYKRELEHLDLFSPLESHASQIIGDKLEKQWRIETNNCKKKKGKPKLWKALAKCFGTNIILVGIAQFILEFILTIPQPIILSKILQYFNGTNSMTKTEAYYWAGLFIVLFVLRSPFFHLSVHSMVHLGMKIRVSCCSLIYRKVLRTSKSAEACSSAGQIVNLLTNDVNSLDYALPFFNYIWMSPIILILIAYIIFIEIELSALTGIALYVLIIPLQGILGKFVPKLSMQSAYRTDKRLRLMNEIIGGVQVIKMYAWEKPFSKLVDKARLKEVSAIRKNYFIDAAAMAFEAYASRLCIFVTIITYALLGNPIIAEKVFMIAAFYNEMRYSMGIAFPLGIQRLAKALASIKRIEEFMDLEEIQESLLEDLSNSNNNNGHLVNNKDIVLNLDVNNLTDNKSEANKNNSLSIKNGIVNSQQQSVVILQNATAKWEKSSTDYNLKSINFTAKRGELTAVVGQVGSGKTSLFHAILKELPLITGNLHVSGKVVYVSQEPWIFASSIRQNILFGATMNKQRYDKVIRVCQLETDFMMFPHKDQTIIGEKGINLSGGQRARINLARAIYAEADIYLLDDPLSAVDTHVGRSLYEKCICKYLKGKTRILVTHQLQFINSADQIYVLNNGGVQSSGTFQELKKSGLDFLSVLQATEEEVKEKDDKDQSIMNDTIAEDVTSEEERAEVAEHRSFGKISHKVYTAYFKAVGNYWYVALVFLMLMICQLLLCGSDFHLSKWVDAENNVVVDDYGNTTITKLPEGERNLYIYIYSALICGAVIMVYLKSICYYDMCLRSSRNLHSNMFYNIIRASMLFFHTNPSGRIINRFSKDIGQVDKYLPFSLYDVLDNLFFMIIVLAMTFSVNYYLIIPSFIVGIILYTLKTVYIKTSRSIKRLEGITRSPVFSHLSATLNGLSTIRAFRAQVLLTKEFDNHQDVHSATWYLFFSCSRAFGYYLELFCNIYVGIVIYSFLLVSSSDSVGNVGLIITQTTMLAGYLQWGIVQASELENQMTAVERIMEYTNIQKEPPLESSSENKPAANWPDKGRVEFRNVCLSYTQGGDFVLKHLSFVVKPTEKIGIVGRTGAGKSSLISALFRLSFLEGEIYIDGTGTSKLGLHDLRSKISIIPQEPLLFAGTLRENIDPFEEYTDDELWESLDEVELKEAVAASGLYGKVSDGGANFSVGQRQLLCLARAIVRKNKILVLDEATANVDPQTDALIQKTIRKRFENCTVFIIAHRLNTVMDCDKFIVMDAGHMVEFNHPYLLLQQEQGYLYDMVQQTGPEMAVVLTKMAEASYNTIKLR